MATLKLWIFIWNTDKGIFKTNFNFWYYNLLYLHLFQFWLFPKIQLWWGRAMPGLPTPLLVPKTRTFLRLLCKAGFKHVKVLKWVKIRRPLKHLLLIVDTILIEILWILACLWWLTNDQWEICNWNENN